MDKTNEIKLVGLPDFVEPRPDIGADMKTVAACFKETEEFTFKAAVAPEVIAIMLGAVKITRCENCKNCQIKWEGYYCTKWRSYAITPNDYCSHASPGNPKRPD